MNNVDTRAFHVTFTDVGEHVNTLHECKTHEEAHLRFNEEIEKFKAKTEKRFDIGLQSREMYQSTKMFKLCYMKLIKTSIKQVRNTIVLPRTSLQNLIQWLCVSYRHEN